MPKLERLLLLITNRFHNISIYFRSDVAAECFHRGFLHHNPKSSIPILRARSHRNLSEMKYVSDWGSPDEMKHSEMVLLHDANTCTPPPFPAPCSHTSRSFIYTHPPICTQVGRDCIFPVQSAPLITEMFCKRMGEF